MMETIKEVQKLSEREIKLKLEDRLSDVARLLSKGKDVEIRKVRNDITVAEVKRTVVKWRQEFIVQIVANFFS